jgi:hypothetical protein
MTEPRYFRTLIVPLGVAVVFLVLAPRLCQRMVVQASKRGPLIATTSTAPPVHGLVIASDIPDSAPPSAMHFPPGLDAARIQYLLEIDPAFTVPMSMPVRASSPITPLLLERKFVEKRPDETFAPTREGLMNISAAADSPDGWMVPVARREFVRLQGIEDAGDGRFDVAVQWRWQPEPLFLFLLPRPTDHHLTAEFAGGEGHWVLTRFVAGPDPDFK